jgi:hypothetical protein
VKAHLEKHNLPDKVLLVAFSDRAREAYETAIAAVLT